MRVQKKIGVVSLFLFGVMLSLSLLDFAVTGQDVPSKSANTRTTLRTLGSVLGSMDQATVSEDFVVSLYTNDQVEKNQQKKAAQNKRHEEYNAKRKLLDKRIKDMRRKQPNNFSREVIYAVKFFGGVDFDRNGILEGEEIEKCKDADNDADGRVNKPEFIHWRLTRRRLNAGDDAHPTVGEVEELISQQAAVEGHLTKLTKDFEDALRYSKPNTYYRIVEASSEFLRLRNDTEEQIIPYASIRKFRQSLPR